MTEPMRLDSDATATSEPGRIVDVLDYSLATLQTVVSKIEASTTFTHFVYREAELDTLLRLVGTAVDDAHRRGAQDELARLRLVLQGVTDAHNLVGDREPRQAAERLREAVGVASRERY